MDVDARGRPRNGVWWEYYDPSVCERARQGLTGLFLKNQRVICTYATPGAPQPTPEDARPQGDDMTEPPKAPCNYEVPEAGNISNFQLIFFCQGWVLGTVVGYITPPVMCYEYEAQQPCYVL